MPHKKYYIQLWVLVAAILVFGVLTWLFAKIPAGMLGPIGNTIQPPASTTAGNPSVPTHLPPPPPVAQITITSPAQDAAWVLQNQNTITWNQAAGSPGGIYLLNAGTGAIVGWIEQQVSATQTSFSWNTRDVFVSRTSPIKADVPAGRYRIALTFSSTRYPTVTSQTFSIIPLAEAQVATSTIVIQGTSFSPVSITVAKGTELLFVNHDTTSYKISASTVATITVGASASQTFDTSILSPGNYIFYSTIYPTLRLSITVK